MCARGSIQGHHSLTRQDKSAELSTSKEVILVFLDCVLADVRTGSSSQYSEDLEPNPSTSDAGSPRRSHNAGKAPFSSLSSPPLWQSRTPRCALQSLFKQSRRARSSHFAFTIPLGIAEGRLTVGRSGIEVCSCAEGLPFSLPPVSGFLPPMLVTNDSARKGSGQTKLRPKPTLAQTNLGQTKFGQPQFPVAWSIIGQHSGVCPEAKNLKFSWELAEVGLAKHGFGRNWFGQTWFGPNAVACGSRHRHALFAP